LAPLKCTSGQDCGPAPTTLGTAHLFLAPTTAKNSTAANADPTIATDLMKTNVKAVSAGELISESVVRRVDCEGILRAFLRGAKL